MLNKNRTGSRTDPLGTPDVTGISVEVSPSRATHCVRPKKKTLTLFREYMMLHHVGVTYRATWCG